jgi:hypothetical protein
MPRTSLDQLEEILAILSSPYAIKNYHQSGKKPETKNPAGAGLVLLGKSLLN